MFLSDHDKVFLAHVVRLDQTRQWSESAFGEISARFAFFSTSLVPAGQETHIHGLEVQKGGRRC